MKYVLDPIYIEGPQNDAALREAIAKRLGFHPSQFRYEILDREFRWSGASRGIAYTVSVETIQFVRDTSIRFLPEFTEPIVPRYGGKDRPVVVGAGLSGLVAAYVLALAGAKPILLERGKKYDERLGDISLFDMRNRLDEESNGRFGFGGVLSITGFTVRQDRHGIRGELHHLFRELGLELNVDHDQFVSPKQATGLFGKLVEEITKRGGEIHYGARVVGLKSFLGKIKEVRYCVQEEELSIATAHVLVCAGEENPGLLKQMGVVLPEEPSMVSFYLEKPSVELNRAAYGLIQKDDRFPSLFHLGTGVTKNGLLYELAFFYEKARPCYLGKSPGEVVLGVQMGEPSSQCGLISITLQTGESLNSVSGLSRIGFKKHLPYLCPGEPLKNYMMRQEPLRLGTIKPGYAKGVYLGNLNALFGGRIGDGLYQILEELVKTQDSLSDGRALLLGPGLTLGNGASTFAKTKGKTNVRGLYFAAPQRNWAYDGLSTGEAGWIAALSLIAGN